MRRYRIVVGIDLSEYSDIEIEPALDQAAVREDTEGGRWFCVAHTETGKKVAHDMSPMTTWSGGVPRLGLIVPSWRRAGSVRRGPKRQ